MVNELKLFVKIRNFRKLQVYQGMVMNQQQLSFLLSSIEFLEAEFRREEHKLFLDNCMKQLAESGRITRSELTNIAATVKAREPKTYDTWLTKFCNLQRANQSRLWAKYGEGLHRFPMLVRRASDGGAGNETYFELEPIEPEKAAINNELQPKQSESHIGNNILEYRAERLKRTPWYLNLCNPIFQTRRPRQLLLFGILLIFWLTPLAIAAWFVGANLGVIIYPIWAWITIVFSYCALWRPLKNLLAIATRKISLLEHLLSPYGAVCISEVVEEKTDVEARLAKRKLVSFDVYASCPICNQAHKLTKSIVLQKESWRSARLIGVCLNNPLEHRFTFDKDTMTGYQLK